MKYFGGFIVFSLCVVLLTGCTLVMRGCGWAAGIVGRGVNESVEVGFAELGPEALNQKYEWFKNVLAQLDAKDASLSAMASKMDQMREDYGDASRANWDRIDKQTMSQWAAERDGLKLSYNNLAAQYNAEMAKWHTEFLNVGKIPAGGDPNMPREVAPYIDN